MKRWTLRKALFNSLAFQHGRAVQAIPDLRRALSKRSELRSRRNGRNR
ncbi:MAG: hypothetical protein O7F12_15830 [Nitrospirae bacterium]|nr:hypothetical protein [Nitrospirota bacterium]